MQYAFMIKRAVYAVTIIVIMAVVVAKKLGERRRYH